MIFQTAGKIPCLCSTMFGGPSRHLRHMRYTVSPYERNQWIGRHDYESARPRSQTFSFSSARTLQNVPSSLSEDIMLYYEKNKQSPETYQKKMALRNALFRIMKGVFPHCGLYVTGSSMNGFGVDKSDIDFTLMISNNEITRHEAIRCIVLLHHALRKCAFLKNIQTIRAICPILKFTDKYSGVECDLSVNNSVGIRNTHLLNVYSQLDNRVAPLVMIVKRWAHLNQINDAHQGTISSYSLVLMVIHYLQVCSPSVLPSLQSQFDEFSDKTDIRLLTLNDAGKYEFTSLNTVDVGQLFFGFLNYFANVFDFEHSCISIRLGKAILKRDVQEKALHLAGSTRQWKFICIEEPFNLSNTARAVHRQDKFMKIRYAFQSSYQRLQENRDLRSIMP